MTETNWLPIIDQAKCTGCGHCVSGCPTGTLSLFKHFAMIAKPESCTYCGICEMICPTEAISLPYEICWES